MGFFVQTDLLQTTLSVSLTPADFAAWEERDLSEVVCVVFDVLRATSSMITALANGAKVIFPVVEISEALAMRQNNPHLLLAGERDGVRILSSVTGTISFDLGNSPREFTAQTVQGRSIAMTTTNGTRALRACSRAWASFISSFLNLRATAELLRRESPRHLLLVCSGTFEQAAFEDVLAAGALCDLLWNEYRNGAVSDSAEMARTLFQVERADLRAAITRARNGKRLLANPELCADVDFCLQTDLFNAVGELGPDGGVRLRNS
jgi:2-phosphosulfolactate phosphatase